MKMNDRGLFTLRYDGSRRLPRFHRRARHRVRQTRFRHHHAQRPRGARAREVSGTVSRERTMRSLSNSFIRNLEMIEKNFLLAFRL